MNDKKKNPNVSKPTIGDHWLYNKLQFNNQGMFLIRFFFNSQRRGGKKSRRNVKREVKAGDLGGSDADSEEAVKQKTHKPEMEKCFRNSGEI